MESDIMNRKENKEKIQMKGSRYNMKKGISLITLIITIIVIIILAGAIILSLNNTNIIGNANKAVELSNISNLRSRTNLINSNLKLSTAISSKPYNRDIILEEIKKEMNIGNENVKGNLITTKDNKYEIMINNDNTIDVVKKGEGYVDAIYLEPADESLFKVTNNEDGTVTINEYLGDEVSVKIPNTIGGKSVSKLQNRISIFSVFPKENLKSVVIPDSVKFIGDCAFCGNKLKEVKIPNSVTSIGGDAFSFNELESIELSDQLVSMGNYSFRVNKLKNVEIPKTMTNIGYEVFFNNQLTNLKIPSNIKSIKNSAFQKNQLRSLEILNGLTDIGEEAFSQNQLTNLKIPSSVKNIGKLAFSFNNINNLEIPSSVINIGNGAFNKNALSEKDAYIYARKSTGEIDKTKLISYAGISKKVDIPDNVEIINPFSFYDTDIESVVIPSSVKEINYSFFCENLKRVEFKGDVPLKLDHNIFLWNKDLKVKVPIEKLEAYKSAKSSPQYTPSKTWFGYDGIEYLNTFCTEF